MTLQDRARHRQMLAVVHIEKAAGTTLIHILRRNYPMRYLWARPLSPASHRCFCARDMDVAVRLHPWMACFGGHAVKPCSDLHDRYRGIRYLTLVREPAARFVSHYLYWKAHMGRDLSFERFLELDTMADRQTCKIAGGPDVDRACEMLARDVWLAGCVERFDEFLVLLTDKLSPQPFRPWYRRRNVARHPARAAELLDRYAERIAERNAADLTLYQFVTETLHRDYCRAYPGDLQADVERLQVQLATGRAPYARWLVDLLFRRLYLDPVMGVIRRRNGLRFRGDY